ncbi:hypothetical protein C0989_000633 [Termitomyces sp. Mn162]|nr:hypothetical protein C0989_000633 [Termitomyces sp. Mn162]
MSIFARPPSPPPRQPSPELHYSPLPSPHARARHRTLSSHTDSAPATPPGLPVPKPRKAILTVRSLNDLPSSSRSLVPHRRSLSTAIPYRSPPPTPTVVSPPPPVPPIPTFALSPPTPIKSCPRPAAITPIHLPDLDSVPPLPEPTAKQPSPTRQHKVAMTCLRFFSLRNSKRRSPVVA